MKIKLQNLALFTERDVEDAISRNDDDELVFVPLTVALGSPDPGYAQQVCVRLAADTRAAIRGNALISLGHLARRFRSLDESRVRPLIEAGLVDHDEYVQTSAGSAADEIHQFLGWSFPGHFYGI